MPRRIRKQVHELSAADFEAHPCWVYASDQEDRPGQDECTVRPLKLEDLSSEAGPVLVQAAFLFPTGGFVQGQSPSMPATIFRATSQWSFLRMRLCTSTTVLLSPSLRP